jgi:lipopolysaccharide/colanic/teichoic acid biosynthesis glycosyltransferase
MKRENRLIIKRIFDIFVSGLSLIFLLPIFLVIGLFIKLDSKGPVFFIQERVGKDGKLFKIYKLRTMYFDRDDDGKGLTNNDPRITSVGRYLRWGIDELPQLINVFKGDISLVGPRATVPEHVKKYTKKEKRRLEMKPGITGWALVNGRNKLSWKKKIEYDIWYIDNWSFWLDIKILFMTIWVIFVTKEGIYGDNGNTGYE